MKKILIIIVSHLLILVSCATNDSKKAYCFSMVFGKGSEGDIVTAYCRTLKDASSGEMKNIVLRFHGKDFREALGKVSDSDYDIYFGSIRAYYISKGLDNENLSEISLVLFDNAKYNTDNHVFGNGNDTAPEALHKEAADVCENEGIRKSRMHLYTSTPGYFRKQFVLADIGQGGGE